MKKPMKRVNPEAVEQEALAEQVMTMMGESAPVKGGRVTNMSPRERMLSSQKGRYGETVEDAPTDGMIEDSIVTTIDELGEDALNMDSTELLNAIGREADEDAVMALDKLDPEDRIAVLRMIQVGPGDSLVDDANQAAARKPVSSRYDQEMQEGVEADLMKQMGER